MKKEFKQGMYVQVLSRKGFILGNNGTMIEGQPVGKIVKIFKYTESKYKYKVRIAPRTYVYCTEKEIADYKIEK